MIPKITIDTAIAKRMVAARAISSAAIIGQPGGWSVMLKVGLTEQPLGAQRSDKPRVWKSLDRCVDYLKTELHIARFDMLDATHYSDLPMSGKPKSKVAERMRETHEAAAYNRWLKTEIQEAIDDPGPLIPHDEVMRNVRDVIKRAKAKRASG